MGDPCDRACLTEFNDQYLAALIANDATMLVTAATVRFTENGKELPLTQGLWAVARSVGDFRQDFAVPAQGRRARGHRDRDDRGAPGGGHLLLSRQPHHA
jgi:hypothetical protein